MTRLTGLIGAGIPYSLSPKVHEDEARALGLKVSYRLLDADLEATGDETFTKMVDTAIKNGFVGVNVTQPFKTDAFRLADSHDEVSAVTGAVNTLVFNADGVHGYNTDAVGFANGLQHGLPDRSLRQVVQFGAGGAGAATAYALLSLGARNLALVDPEGDRSAELAVRLSHAFPDTDVLALSPRDAAAAVCRADGVVNASVVGSPAHPGSPLESGLLGRRQWAADVNYAEPSGFLRAAAAAGAPHIDGARMLVFQACASFRLFHGVSADGERMWRRFSSERKAA